MIESRITSCMVNSALSELQAMLGMMEGQLMRLSQLVRARDAQVGSWVGSDEIPLSHPAETYSYSDRDFKRTASSKLTQSEC